MRACERVFGGLARGSIAEVSPRAVPCHFVLCGAVRVHEAAGPPGEGSGGLTETNLGSVDIPCICVIIARCQGPGVLLNGAGAIIIERSHHH
jgi:hypothetical protein